MTRRLTLKSERLVALTTEELHAIAGALQEITPYCTQLIPTNYCTGVYPTINYDCVSIVTDRLPPTN